MTTFVSEARIVQTVLDPRTGTSHIVDFQYERDRRAPKPYSTRRTSPQVAPTDIRRTLLAVGFDAPLASEIAREFVDLEDGA
jgi:hypothetical protein